MSNDNDSGAASEQHIERLRKALRDAFDRRQAAAVAYNTAWGEATRAKVAYNLAHDEYIEAQRALHQATGKHLAP